MKGVHFELLLGKGNAQLVDLNLPVFGESLIICRNLKRRRDEVNPGDEFGDSAAATRPTTQPSGFGWSSLTSRHFLLHLFIKLQKATMRFLKMVKKARIAIKASIRPALLKGG